MNSEQINNRTSAMRRDGMLRVLLIIIVMLLYSLQSHSQSRQRQTSEEVPHLSVYPNPSSGKFNVTVKDQDGPFDVNVYNLIGELIFHWESAGSANANIEFNLAKYPKGVYFIELDTEKANTIKKIIIDNGKDY
jgi:hypothetical protein